MEMTEPMQITLNGTAHQIDRPMPVSELLETLGFGGKPVVIELDEEAVFPRNYASVEVREGSRVEVVTLAAGG